MINLLVLLFRISRKAVVHYSYYKNYDCNTIIYSSLRRLINKDVLFYLCMHFASQSYYYRIEILTKYGNEGT